MERRDFLKGNFSRRQNYTKLEPEEILSDLSKYDKPLGILQAAHLLRRTTLGPTPGLLKQFTGMNVDDAVDLILGKDSDPLNNGTSKLSWLDTQEEDPLSGLPLEIKNEIEGRLGARYTELTDWWLEEMRNESQYFQEKFTLFLSTVWCVEFTYDTLALMPPPLLYRNNERLRKFRTGNYHDLAFDMTLDGAMLLYQSLNYSTAKSPNENYMRELMELFTMGIGNYSEGDIREGARTLTGWRVAAYKYQPAPNGKFGAYFSPGDHDIQAKQLMGVTIPARGEFDNSEFQVKEEEVKKLIDILFEQRPQQIAKFICEKIYRYFVYSSPGDVQDTIVNQLAQTFVQNNFQLKAVYKQLFTSQHFFDIGNTGCQIKTPPEYITGLQRALETEYKTGTYNKSREACEQLEMELYNPPNVGSWIGYRTWISTTTYPLRVEYAKEILEVTSDAKLIEIVKKGSGYTNLAQAIEWLFALLVPITPNSERFEYHKNIALDILNSSNWANEIENSTPKAAAVIRGIIESMIYVPDFSLC